MNLSTVQPYITANRLIRRLELIVPEEARRSVAMALADAGYRVIEMACLSRCIRDDATAISPLTSIVCEKEEGR